MESIIDNAKALALEYMKEHPDAWEILRTRDRGTPFSRETSSPVIKLMDDIDAYSGYMHSSASLSIIMRYLESMI